METVGMATLVVGGAAAAVVGLMWLRQRHLGRELRRLTDENAAKDQELRKERDRAEWLAGQVKEVRRTTGEQMESLQQRLVAIEGRAKAAGERAMVLERTSEEYKEHEEFLRTIRDPSDPEGKLISLQALTELKRQMDHDRQRLREQEKQRDAVREEHEGQVGELRAEIALRDRRVEQAEAAVQGQVEEIGALKYRLKEQAEQAAAVDQKVAEAVRDERERHRADLEGKEAELAALRQQLERAEQAGVARRLQRLWPASLSEAGLGGFQDAVVESMLGDPPVPQAAGLLAACHRVCAPGRKGDIRDEVFELGCAYYIWRDTVGEPDPAWDARLAAWLSDRLAGSQTQVMAVREGEPVSPKRHRVEGRGPVVKRVRSFLLLRSDGSPSKRAHIEAGPPADAPS